MLIFPMYLEDAWSLAETTRTCLDALSRSTRSLTEMVPSVGFTLKRSSEDGFCAAWNP